MKTYEIDTTTATFPACSVNRLFNCVTEQQIKTTVYYFRVVYPSGNAYEIEGVYLDTEATMIAINNYRKEVN